MFTLPSRLNTFHAVSTVAEEKAFVEGERARDSLTEALQAVTRYIQAATNRERGVYPLLAAIRRAR